ncbi:MAG: 3-oxoacyl-[acyl-carrier-protein] reductase [Nitrospiraceae bacterium]|nr:3-oxoacyl-[acyl-carrier-protein] reductase [Nitrospiraceae bacterium]
MKRMEGKVCIVTGSGRGIGRAIALKFAKEGGKVVIWDMDEENAKKVSDECKSFGTDSMGQKVNATDREEIQKGVAEIKEKFGQIDVLVNNAGITRDALLTQMDEKMWDAVIDVNLKGTFNCTQFVVPVMEEKNQGSIVSIASVVGIYGNMGQTNYAASKAGIIGMTKSWSKELARSGIRVNAVAPGFIKTPMTKKVPEKVINYMVKRTPLRRMGEAEEVANAVLFLSSNEASFITGHILQVDGGLTL